MTKQKIAVSNQHASLSAADLAELGLSPIPVRAREKRPVEAGWQSAPINAEATARHIARGGNVGLRMGPQPDGRRLVAIDDDEPGAVAAAEAELGALPATLTNRTAHGHHRIFEWPADRAMPANAVRVRRGIDVRSAGGQIVVAPSLHPSGHRYEWVNVANPVALPDAWVEALAARAPRYKPVAGSASKSAPVDRIARVIGVLYPYYAAGGRHTLTRALGSWGYEVGLEDAEIRAVVESLPSDQTPKRVRDALEAAARKREGAPTIGRGELAGRLGEDDMARLERAVETSFGRRARERQAEAQRKQAENDNDPDVKLGAVGTERSASDALGKRHSFADAEHPIDYLCEGLRLAASDGKISLIAGDPGGGKGPIANHLAVCFALGLKAFGEHVCKQASVLLLDCEGARLTMRRLRRLARGAGRKPEELEGRLHVFDASAADTVSDAYLEALKSFVAEHGIGVVVLDSYTSAMLATGLDANKPEFALLAKSLGQLGVLVLAVAHANKEAAKEGKEPKLSSVAYSGAFAAMAQTAIVVSYPDPNDRNTIRVGCARAPETGFASFVMRFADKGADALQVTAVRHEAAQAARAEAFAVERQETVARRADDIERILARDDSGRGIGTTALKQEAGLSGTTWPEARDECLRRGSMLQGTGYKTGSIAWSYIPPDRRPAPEPLGAKLKRERASRDKGQRGQ